MTTSAYSLRDMRGPMLVDQITTTHRKTIDCNELVSPAVLRTYQAVLGEQVLRVGPGLDRINPLDAGPWRQVLDRVNERTGAVVRAAVTDRRLNMLVALATLVRRRPVTSDETTVLAAALRYLAERETDTRPVLSDVLRVIRDAPAEVRAVTLWQEDGDVPRFREDVANLHRTLLALLHGPLGDTFEGQTTTPIRLDTPAVCVDIFSIDDTDELRTAATLLSTWSYGFAQVEAAHLMADLGLAPPRTFFTVLDELWRALRVGHGLIAHTVAGGMPLRQSWEDMAVDIWGPRTGMTTCRAIPAIVAAPGPTLVTSVKGDIVDATRDIRAARGTVWAFDPQHILGPKQGM
ncbi:hypothetical protein ACGFIR_09725 [Micromonospora sp. NPDC049051]|uniref:hypothetical protein n=1 Tax=Micromonospora sp. NPDC049051 TaxID=3364264 RepID=UPI0037220013